MNSVRPKRGIYFTPQNVEDAKRNIASYPWAEQAFARLKRQGDAFLRYGDDVLYDCVLGMRGQTFAYGISGCPACGRPFPMQPDEQRPMFSPIEALPAKTVTCPHCRTVLPGGTFPDSGQGFEHNGKGYYPIGMWNFFTAGDWLGGVRNHEGMVTKLTYLYMLTGEAEYARKALVLLDAFSAIWHGTIGPRDFTPFGSDYEIGRLHLLTSIVHRVKVCLAQDYDWLYERPELDRASPARARLGERMTMRQNIEAMLNDYMLAEPGGPAYDLRGGNLTNLQNHESDGVRAMLAVGLALDNRDYCAWGAQAVEAYVYNAIGRDGMYYEGSYGYSLFTASVLLDMALLAMRASDEKQLAAFHPFACDRFYRFAVENPLELLCQGHLPCYGDWGKDTAEGRRPDLKLLTETYRAALFFYQFAPDGAIRASAEAKLNELYPSVAGQLGGKGVDLFFRHPVPAEPFAEKRFRLPTGSAVWGQAGIGILRDANDTTVLMRFGPNRTHGHDDVLAFNYYAHGKEISADLGYGIYGTNAHYGWGTKAAAHNTVVVDEDRHLEAGRLYKPFPGGELTFLYESPHLTAMEGKAPGLYGIEAYQRMLGVVPVDDASSYVVDLFYVEGGRTADYMFHAFHGPSALVLSGADDAGRPHWTLAGVDRAEKPYFDAPGRSFGERLAAGETFSPLLDGEKGQGWTTEPNNGYGFIYGVKEYRPVRGTVEAEWREESGDRLRLLALCDETDRLFTGTCPGLEGTTRHPVLVWRSSRPATQFAAVMQAATGRGPGPVVSEMVKLPARGDRVTAFRVSWSGDAADYWLYSPVCQSMEADTPWGVWRVQGRCAWVRVDSTGRLIAHACVEADFMEWSGVRRAGRERVSYRVEEVRSADGGVLLTATPIARAGDDAAAGRAERERDGGFAAAPRLAYVRDTVTGNTSVYRLGDVREEGGRVTIALRDSIVLSKGVVKRQEENRIHTSYPLPLGVVMQSPKTASPFRGKAVLGERGGMAVIRAVRSLKEIEIEPVRPFAVDEKFDIVDIWAGDEVILIRQT